MGVSFLYEIMNFFLENGMKVILHCEKNTKVVKVGVVVNQGSVNENENNNGISHFIEHILIIRSKSSPKLSNYYELLSVFGASYSAITYKSHTVYYISGLSQGINTYLNLLKEIVFCFWQHKFLAVRNLIFRAPLSH